MGQWVGFDIRDVRASAVAGIPEDQLSVMIGVFDPPTIETALENCVATVFACYIHEDRTYQGVDYYTWPENGEPSSLNLSSWSRPPGLHVDGRTAVAEAHVLQGSTTPGIESLIDAGADHRPSLVDYEDFRLLADAMTELGAAMAVLSSPSRTVDDHLDPVFGYDPEFGNPPREEVDKLKDELREGALKPHTAFAVGIGVDDFGPYLALALVHTSAELAQENVDQLPRRISSSKNVDFIGDWTEAFVSVEARADGHVLLAKLRGPITDGYNWVGVALDSSLLLHTGTEPAD